LRFRAGNVRRPRDSLSKHASDCADFLTPMHEVIFSPHWINMIFLR
jgi:hypothetical protein